MLGNKPPFACSGFWIAYHVFGFLIVGLDSDNWGFPKVGMMGLAIQISIKVKVKAIDAILSNGDLFYVEKD